MIFFLFEPLKIKERKYDDVPLFEIKNFIMHELDNIGLKTLMIGDKALKYEDRYVVDSIDFTDNSQGYISNMKADIGVYKEELVNLKGNIVYIREDGLTFNSDTMSYNTATAVAKTDSNYTASRDKSTMVGESLEYDSKANKIKSKNVFINYQLEGDDL